MYSIDMFFEVAGVLISVAFLTLFERKVMGFMQCRKGPMKALFFGVFQPFSDAIKLFLKESNLFYFFYIYFYLMAPFFGFVLMVFLWLFFPSWFTMYGGGMEMILLFSILSFSPFFLFFCGYGSSSPYSNTGFIRSISQTISYEVSLLLYILIFVFSFMEVNLMKFQIWESGSNMIFFMLPFFILWIFLSMAESNRSPFDFSEGESELVSGFNVEYGGGLFSLIFIVEYGMIIFMSFIGSLIFFGSLSLLPFIMAFSFLYLWVRSCYPRFRYDLMMMSSWLSILPFILIFIIYLIECFS